MTDWTLTMSSYIKSLDPQHLVIDGRHGVDPGVLDEEVVDIVSRHYYPNGKPFKDCLMEDLEVGR